jgi:hypothetical protein
MKIHKSLLKYTPNKNTRFVPEYEEDYVDLLRQLHKSHTKLTRHSIATVQNFLDKLFEPQKNLYYTQLTVGIYKKLEYNLVNDSRVVFNDGYKSSVVILDVDGTYMMFNTTTKNRIYIPQVTQYFEDIQLEVVGVLDENDKFYSRNIIGRGSHIDNLIVLHTLDVQVDNYKVV